MAQMRVNRFGRLESVSGCKIKQRTNRKTGEVFDIATGYVEIPKPGLYKIEVNESKKEGVEAWVKITKVEQNTGFRFQSMTGRYGYGPSSNRY